MSLDAALGAFSSLHLLRPQWLWALLALPLLVTWWRVRRQRRSVWRDVVDPHLLPHVLDSRGGARGPAGPWLLMLAWVLGVCALAGPSWRKGEQPLLQTEAPLIIALDLSSATLAEDMPPSRLLQARAKIADLLRRRAGGQVGLVAFADDAYTVAPLTDDTANVALFLDSLSPEVMPVDGSRADRAIAWSARLLKQAGFAGGDILLLSDHADAAARTAASEARAVGARVSVLGLGSAAGSAYRTPDGAIANTRLDATSLQALASAGGGRYQPLAADSGDLAALGVLDALDRGDGTTAAAAGGKTSIWRDDGYWLLLPLLLLAALAFRRGGVLAVLLVVAFLPLRPAHAADDRGTWWRRADQVQHQRMQGGADAYRGDDFAAAEQQWKGLPGADADYNRGNALAKAGRYEDAIAAYDQALRAQPGMADATANRDAVEAAMKRKPPPSKQGGRGKQQPSQGGKPKDAQDGQQGGQSPQSPPGSPQDKQDQTAPPPPPSQQSGQPRPPDKPADGQPPQGDDKTPPSGDPARQRDADAQQRARMQQALQRQRDGQPKDDVQGQGRQVGAETTAQRERRQANDAWLRRVPDDPGGLLRAKFRLEYERREETGEP